MSLSQTQMLHMAVEVAMFAGMSYYLSNKIKGLKHEVEELKGKLNAQQSSMDKNFGHIYSVLEDMISQPSSHFHHQEEQKPPSELRNRKKNVQETKQRKEQEYLGSSDEIDAYGYNIACELLWKFRNSTDNVIKYLDEDQHGKKRNYNSWRMYLKAFNHDHEHPIIKRVKQKVVRYLPNAMYGKPYRNRDWISN